MHLPTGEFARLKKHILDLLERTGAERLVINGDVKHAFGRISDAEWRQARNLFAAIQERVELIVVTGNHDAVLGPLAKELGVPLHERYFFEGIYCVHGDRFIEDDMLVDAETIVIGHVHPAVRIQDETRSELYKCYLVGDYEGAQLVVLPSMFSLTTGIDVLETEDDSPYITDKDDMQVYVLGKDRILAFGSVKDLKALSE